MMQKKLLLFALVLVLALSAFALPVAAETVASGSCGATMEDNVTWSLDSDGTLTISGSGDMGASQWNSYRSAITTIVVESGVTSVGNNNFQSIPNLTDVSLPSTLTAIGNNAFYYCQKLEKIVIPGSVKSIGQQAFRNCSGAKVLEINSGLETIGNNAFYGCSSIATPLVIPATVTSMGQGAFRQCTAIPSLELAEGITTVGNQCFYYLRGMKQLKLPSTLTKIGNNAFNNCDSLEELELPGSLTTIDSYAFINCTKLKKVEMPDSLTTLGLGSFDGCRSLTELKLAPELTAIENQTFRNCTALKTLTLSEKIKTIGDNAFYGCTGLTELTFPDSVESLGASSFANCENLTTVTLGKGITALSGNTFTGCAAITDFSIDPGNEKLFIKSGFIFNHDNETAFLAPVPGAGLAGVVTIPDGVTAIPDNAFNPNSTITKVVIPDSVTTIGLNAFRQCSALEEVVMSKNVEAIPNFCFYMCSKLASIELKEGLKSIGQSAFYSCGALTSLELPATVESIGQQAFASCGALTKLDLPAALTTVGSNAFSGCAVEELVFGENATNLASGFCQNAGLLKKVELRGNLTTLQSNAFQNCPKLEEITIPATVTSIGQNAFRQCSSLAAIEIPDSVTSLGSWCFYDCTSLSDVKLGKSVPADQAFGSFTGVWTNAPIATIAVSAEHATMESIDNIIYDKPDHTKIYFAAPKAAGKVIIQEGVTSLESGTFANNDGITELVLPQSLTTIKSRALVACNGLTSLTLPANVTDFSGYAIRQCENLKEIKVENPDYTVKNGVIYSADFKTLKLCPSGYEGSVAVSAKTEEIADAAFFYCGKVTAVTLPKKLKTIGEDGFCGAAAIEKMVVPNSAKDLKPYTFQYCAGLTELTLPAGLTAIPNYMCDGCASLPTIDIPATVTTIGQGAFRNCSGLTAVELPVNLESIGNYGFSGCTNLQQVEIPESLTVLPNYCFQNCSYMPSIILPDTITALNAESLPTQASGCVFDTIYYRGNDSQWAAIAKNADIRNVEIVYLYGSEGEPPVITEQPQNIAVGVGETATLTLKVKAPADPDDTVTINWYSNTTASATGGTLFQSADGLISSITPPTDATGNKYYYAIVTKTTDSGSEGMVVSDVATVTVLMDDFEGRGTEGEPYLINNIDDLQTLADIVATGKNLNGINFKITADITLPDTWKGIGTGNQNFAFTGILDGDNHTVTSAYGGLPLFGYTAGCTIKNINIAGEYIAEEALIANYTVASNFGYVTNIDNVNIKAGTVVKGNGYISGYASSVNRINITNCTVEAGVKIGWDAEKDASNEAGAVGSFGGSYNGNITNCVSYADVYGARSVGGIMGDQGQSMSSDQITNCAFYGTVNASGERAGGIVGSGYDNETAPNGTAVTIQNCVVGGTITGADRVGGIYGSEGGVEQNWGNAAIRNNVFYGKVVATGENPNSVGAIIGRMCSLNKFNLVENNYYEKGCGADKGIGRVIHVDTSGRPYGIDEETGVFYYDTSKDSIAEIHLIVDPPGDQYTSVVRTDHNRDDDPLGKDADKLAKGVSAAEMTGSTVVEALNDNANSLHNWINGENGYPVQSSEPIPFGLTVSGDFKTEYLIGEELDLTGAEFKVTYSDNSVKDVPLAEVEIKGFDSSQRALLTLTASYQGLTVEIPVRVVKPTYSNEITVYFTLLGDKVHDADADEEYHTYEEGTLETWIPRQAMTVDLNATVLDVLTEALTEKGYKIINPKGDYIAGITTPDRVTISEFTNGTNSGWMYTLNKKHSQLSVVQQFLEDGDEIVFHYTDDYKQEEKREKAAEYVDSLIDKIGDVTLDSEEAITNAKEAYEKLSDAEKELVEKKDVLDDAIAKLAELKGDQAAADAVEDAIEALPAADKLTAADKEAVDKAKAAYDALTDAQKALVPEETKKALDDAVAAVAKAVDDKAAADAVKEAIEALPATDKLTANDKAAVEKARADYDKLSDAQKALVGDDATKKLADAETKIKELDPKPRFVDVPDNAYFKEAVDWAVSHEPVITTGTDATHFTPNGDCTRGQVVTFLWRAAGTPEPTSTTNPFVDVPANQYYYKAVLWAVEKGVTTGTDKTHFTPNGKCTRGQVVTFLWRANGSPEVDANVSFNDVKTGAYYEKAVKWAVANKITEGTGAGKFSPDATCTRAQVVTFLYRAQK